MLNEHVLGPLVIISHVGIFLTLLSSGILALANNGMDELLKFKFITHFYNRCILDHWPYVFGDFVFADLLVPSIIIILRLSICSMCRCKRLLFRVSKPQSPDGSMTLGRHRCTAHFSSPLYLHYNLCT